jgi:hypothetical protein
MSLLLESPVSGQQTLMQLPLCGLTHRLTGAATAHHHHHLPTTSMEQVLLMETAGRSSSRDLDNIRYQAINQSTMP